MASRRGGPGDGARHLAHAVFFGRSQEEEVAEVGHQKSLPDAPQSLNRQAANLDAIYLALDPKDVLSGA